MRESPRVRFLAWLPVLAFAAGTACVQAQSAAPAVPDAKAGYGVLVGRWVRPDGGYVIHIKAADAAGKLDASYANPNPLPFYTAEAKRDGSALKLYFELRAGGYNGSTYTLTYDAASDRLQGIYYQAVAKQQFEVAFDRAK